MTKKDVLEILEKMKKEHYREIRSCKATLANIKKDNGGKVPREGDDFDFWVIYERELDMHIDRYSALGEAIEAVKKEDL